MTFDLLDETIIILSGFDQQVLILQAARAHTHTHTHTTVATTRHPTAYKHTNTACLLCHVFGSGLKTSRHRQHKELALDQLAGLVQVRHPLDFLLGRCSTCTNMAVCLLTHTH